MQERQEKLWDSPVLPGTDGRWLRFFLWTHFHPRTWEPNYSLEVREFGPLGTTDGRTGPFKFFVIFPLKLWYPFHETVVKAAGLLTQGRILSLKDEWQGHATRIISSPLVSTPTVGDDFISLILGREEEGGGGSPHCRYRITFISSGRSASGSTIASGPGLILHLGSMGAFTEHLGEVERILQERGLLPAQQKTAA
jgi:hypothetical protein